MCTRVMTRAALMLLLGACNLDAQGLGSSSASASGAGTSSTGDDIPPASTDPDTTGTPSITTSPETTSVDTSTPPLDTTAADPTTDSTTDTSSSTGSSTDETGPPSCAGGLWWDADFSVDPTTLDVNADLLPDWRLRDLDPFPVDELAGGLWVSTPWHLLDTFPLDDFLGRTIAWVRMRSTQDAGDGRGAVMWLNVGYDSERFAPIFASLALQPDGTQRLRVFNVSETPLVELAGLGSGMIEVELDIDVDAELVQVDVDGADQGSFPLAFLPREGNDDRWATLVAWDTAAEFDGVRVEQCL